MIVIGGLGVLLWPLVVLIMAFHGSPPSSTQLPDYAKAAQVIQGDGKEALAPDSVPQYLYDPIEQAGGDCGAIGPVVIAAQIEAESKFAPDYSGSPSAQGISGLDPRIFQQYGTDADGNGRISPFDPEDSVAAQGKYLCALAGQARQLVDERRLTGSVLDLTLAAYHGGMDALERTGGIPATGETPAYISGVRVWFPEFAGVYPPLPLSTATPSTAPSDGPPDSSSPTEGPSGPDQAS
ncbi:lytic transglycosylase domain-containing protein [Streptomyces sp. V4-01]|uniref:Lytic transglycosylase domain-containing protein n=1 Tax=Actinacidiphila polyblastidii TaxID=3110430 RepID=A0ABU7PFA2_9ACTN|nr:lytic transglycosylase domain-containing protein [Streptomyces sp. V4-01]